MTDEKFNEIFKDAVFTGRTMTFNEIIEAARQRCGELAKDVEQALQAGDEQKAADIINYRADNYPIHQKQVLLQIFADQFTDQRLLFDLIIDVYTDDGYNCPKRLIQLAKRIAKTAPIPAEHRLKGLPDTDPVTVWRGTMTADPDSGNVLRTEVSWTTDKATAIWFANRMRNPDTANGKGAVWQATIERSKIIAFTQARQESEVIQHMGVKDPHMLTIDPDEWTAAAEKVEARNRAHDLAALHTDTDTTDERKDDEQ